MNIRVEKLGVLGIGW